MRLDQSIYAPLYALFVVGPIAMLIEIWWNSHRSPDGNAASAPALASGSAIH
jgi:enediyne biosynthesis protein E5